MFGAQAGWQIHLVPREAVNAYLLEDVLVDAGTPGMGKKAPGPTGLEGPRVTVHGIPHARPSGPRRRIEGGVYALGIELWPCFRERLSVQSKDR